MFLSNWLMITRVVAASVVEAVDYPSPEDFFLVFDGTNQLFMYGGSVDSASNVAIYFEDYKHELGNAWPVTVSEPGDYKALVDVCGTRYLTDAVTVTGPSASTQLTHDTYDKLIVANTSNANTETNLRLGSNVWDLGEVGNVYISKPGDYKSFTVDPDGQVAHFGNVSVAAVTQGVELSGRFESPKFTSNTTVSSDYNSVYGWDTDVGWKLETRPGDQLINTPSDNAPVEHAFDKILTNYYHTDFENVADFPKWILITYPEAVAVFEYTITSRTSYGSQCINTWELQGSNDSTNWSTLDTRSSITWGSQETKTFTFTNENTYTYYRLYVTAGNQSTYYTVAEMVLFCQRLLPLQPPGFNDPILTYDGYNKLQTLLLPVPYSILVSGGTGDYVDSQGRSIDNISSYPQISAATSTSWTNAGFTLTSVFNFGIGTDIADMYAGNDVNGVATKNIPINTKTIVVKFGTTYYTTALNSNFAKFEVVNSSGNVLHTIDRLYGDGIVESTIELDSQSTEGTYIRITEVGVSILSLSYILTSSYSETPEGGRTLYEGSNTYALGTASNVYIADPGDYTYFTRVPTLNYAFLGSVSVGEVSVYDYQLFQNFRSIDYVDASGRTISNLGTYSNGNLGTATDLATFKTALSNSGWTHDVEYYQFDTTWASWYDYTDKTVAINFFVAAAPKAYIRKPLPLGTKQVIILYYVAYEESGDGDLPIYCNIYKTSGDTLVATNTQTSNQVTKPGETTLTITDSSEQHYIEVIEGTTPTIISIEYIICVFESLPPTIPTLTYDSISTLRISNPEASSYITYKSHETNKLLACGTDLTSYRLYQPGNYRALVGGPTTYTITSNVVVPATEILPMYQYPPTDGATSSLTTSTEVNTNSTWELSGASYGNGVYNAQASITATTSNTAYHAFDSNVTAGFESSTSTGSLTFQMPSAAVIRKYVVWPYDTGTTRPSSWTLQGSTDGNSWSTLHAVTTTPPSLTGDAQTLTSFGLYDRYRLNVTANAGGSGLKIAELALWGDVPLDTTPTFSDPWTSGTTTVTPYSAFTLPTITNITGLVVTGSVDSSVLGTYDVSWSKVGVDGIVRRVTRRFEVETRIRVTPRFTSATTVDTDSYLTGWNTSVGWSVTANSVLSSPSLPGWHAFEKTITYGSTNWHSDNANGLMEINPHILTIISPEAFIVKKYRLWDSGNSVQVYRWFPGVWKLQGSNNDIDWEDIGIEQVEDTWPFVANVATMKEYDVSSNTNAYTMHRLRITSGRRDDNSETQNYNYVSIGEWELESYY